MRSYNFYEIESVITLRIIYTLDTRSISFFNSAYAIKKMHHPMNTARKIGFTPNLLSANLVEKSVN